MDFTGRFIFNYNDCYSSKKVTVYRTNMPPAGIIELYSIYLHIPFCLKRCEYCDFNTCAGRVGEIPEYIRALIQEITTVAPKMGEKLPVHTVYFGGGTPSLLNISQVDAVIKTIQTHYRLMDRAEITLEANPGTVTLQYFQKLNEIGINRLSLGLQSVNENELKLLGRIHSFAEVVDAVAWARTAGFENISLDLIYGLPGQQMGDWLNSVRRTLDLNPEHISLYALTLEEDVPMQKKITAGLIPAVDDDLAADMYEAASEILEQAGFRQYEISNWAKCRSDGKLLASQHNLQYWYNLPYLGFGAGAHGCAEGHRLENESDISQYIARCLKSEDNKFPFGPALVDSIRINREAEMLEVMMLGLRLTEEGVSRKKFEDRFGEDLEKCFGDKITGLIQKGLLEWVGNNRETIRLTHRARILGNQVFIQFV